MTETTFKESLKNKNILSTEILAGLTTFLTMAYIIMVNPGILSNTGMDKAALMVITCIVSGLITIATGLLTNAPIAMAPGMGLNAFFAYSLVIGSKVPWPVALGIVFIAGFIFLVLIIVGLRRKLVEAIPKELLNAIAVGIGIFIAFIGLQNAGIIVDNKVTLVEAGPLKPTVLIALTGLVVMVILEIMKVKGSLLIGIATTTFLSILLGYTNLPTQLISFKLDIAPVFGKIDILGALKLTFLAPIFTMMFVDLFDSIGSLLGLATEAQMVDKDGKIPKLDKLLGIDAGATMFGAVCGTSTTTTYIESAAGIASGGRTGITSVVTGLLFLLVIPFIPILGIVPQHATAPALIMVGFFMIKNIGKINFANMEIGFPSFLIIILIALSFSISTGLAFGFLSFSLVKILRGKVKEIKPALWIVNVLCALFFIL